MSLMSLQGEKFLSVDPQTLRTPVAHHHTLHSYDLIDHNPNIPYENMPNSITSVRVTGGSSNAVHNSVSVSSSLAELIELVPAPYRPRTQDLINKVYRSALKSNHVRTYLAKLEKFKIDGTYPPEIGGRVNPPSLQISKEYESSAGCREKMAEFDRTTRAHKDGLLKSAITLKKEELSYLQSLFSDQYYTQEFQAILIEVSRDLARDAGQQPGEDGSFSSEDFPPWSKNDYNTYKQCGVLFPQRAIALAYATVQRENVKHFRTLSLKRTTDEDIDMQDATSKTETVESLVSRKFEQLRKELQKTSMSGMTSNPSSQDRTKMFHTNSSIRQEKRWQTERCLQISFPQEKIRSSQPEQGEDKQGRKRKRERKEEVQQEINKLVRAWGGVSTHPRVADSLWEASSSRSHAVTVVRSRDRVLVSTPDADKFLSNNSELFCGVSASARTQFVSHHTVIPAFEAGHRFADGVFLGPDVAVPSEIEYKIALNSKFILHHNPNLLRVHQAWPHLERSVRIAWHFRKALPRSQSKFYVPKKTWNPPPESWHICIEKGLQKGKDLLFERTAALPLEENHKSNPDLRYISSFLKSNSLLVKLTDKNLGVAIISKPWYQQQCINMLSDGLTYMALSEDDVLWYQNEALKRIKEITDLLPFADQTKEYLHTSSEDMDIPSFHGLPKVHKTVWSFRPIIPSHSWVTRRASEVSDFILRGFHKKEFPWVVDSTKDVINLIEKETILRTEQIWLVTGDVTSFYTNVSVTDTIDRLKKDLLSVENDNGIPPAAVPLLLEAVMGANCFQFDQTFFRQVNGIAMGTSCAPSFANVNLGYLERMVEEIQNAPTSKDGLILYVRYIDDIFLVYKGTEAALQSCLDNITSKLEPFKIGWEISTIRDTTSFLDVEFFFEQGFGPLGVQSRVYRKRMNRHQYIPWSSAHPLSVKKAFIKAELTRFMVISSSKGLFEEKAQNFMQALGRRGYPSATLHIWKKQVNYKDRQYSLSKRKDTSARGLPLMLPSTYDEVWEYIDMREIFNVMRDEWLKTGEPLPASLLGPLIKSLKRSENLFDKFNSWNKAVLQSVSLAARPLAALG